MILNLFAVRNPSKEGFRPASGRFQVFAALALRAFEPSQTAVGDQYEISVTLLDYDKQSAGVTARGRSNEAADLNWKSLQRIASATDAPG